MSGHQQAAIGDTVYFWFAANDTSGSGGDGATPLFDVREAGAAAGAIPLLSGTPTLLSHADYPAGCYEIAVAATTGNGFAANDTFAVFCTLTIDSQNPSGFVGSCTLTPLAKAIDAGYPNGAVSLDTVNGNAGIVPGVNGTSGNPSNTIANATTIAAALGLKHFRVIVGSIVTLAQTYNNYKFSGEGWVLALGGQDVGGTHFCGADVSGVGIGSSEIVFDDCDLGTCTLNPYKARNCGLSGTITAGAVGGYRHLHCNSSVAGISTPVFDTGAALGNVNVIYAPYYNGIDIRNMGQVGTDNLSIAGAGQLILNANCIGGTVVYRGDWDFNDSSTGMTIIEDDNTANVLAAATDTDDIQTRLPAALVGGRMDSDVGVLQADVITAAAIAAAAFNGKGDWNVGKTGYSISGTKNVLDDLNDIAAADVLTQMNAALDTVIAELGVAAPAATPTLRTGLMLLYMAIRNKRDTTAASDEIHNDAGAVIATAVVSDDTVTFEKGEYA